MINQTSYSAEQFLIQIKAQLPPSERERTMSRLMLLLCENEDSIFKYEQFNGGHIENSTKEFGLPSILSQIQLSVFRFQGSQKAINKPNKYQFT